MFVSRMLAGLLIFANAMAVVGQETKPAELPPKVTAQEKEAPNPESDAPNSPAKDAGAEKTEPATPEQLQQWIRDLVHQKFATRQAASQKLVQAGVPGMEAAAEAAKTEDLELATRCLAVLTDGLTSKVDDVRKAAKTALEALTKSDNKSVAQRARQALDTPRGIPPIPRGFGPRIGGNFQQIKVQIAANGNREITAIENGKEVVLKDNNGKDISVTVTETINGQKKSQTYKGKDEDDLKKNHPEAHALFEKYSKGNGGVRIQIGGNAIGGNIFMPVLPQQMRRRIVNPIKAADLFEEVDKLRQKLEEANGRLAKAAESEKPDPADLKKISEEIQSTTKRLAEIKTESQLP